MVPNGQIVSRNLNHLLSAFGPDLGFPIGTTNIINHYTNKFNLGMSSNTICSYLEGTGGNRPQSATLDELVHPFKKKYDIIDGSWLLIPEENVFRDKISSLKGNNYVEIEVPHYTNKIERLTQWIAGTYIVYRYAFEGFTDISREANALCDTFFGVAAGKLEGTTLRQLKAPPEMLTTWIERFRECRATGRPVRFEYQGIVPEQPGLGRGHALADGLAGARHVLFARSSSKISPTASAPKPNWSTPKSWPRRHRRPRTDSSPCSAMSCVRH